LEIYTKMVKTKHFCEWPGCEKDYPTYEGASSCESQGFVGPDIKPGLLLKNSDEYEVFIGCRNVGHNRVNKSVVFMLNPERKEGHKILFLTEMNNSSKVLDDKIKKGDYAILDAGEFRKAKECVDQDYNLRRSLKGFELYGEHPYFTKDA